MAITYLDIQGTYNGPGAYSYNVASYPGGGIFYVNSATGLDNRGRVKFMGQTSQSGVRPAGTQGPVTDPTKPLASVFGPNGAISFCQAGSGDVIVVAPGHVETLASGAAVTVPNDVTIVGGSYGNRRPTFQFTNAGSFITFAGACQMQNLIFDLTQVAALTKGFLVNTGGVQFIMCKILQASATNQAATAVLLNAGGDDCQFVNTEIDAILASGAANAISNPTTNNINRLIISGCYFHGNWSGAAVSLLSTGSAEFLIEYSVIKNTNAAGFCLNLAAGNTLTGAVSYVDLYTQAATTAGFIGTGGGGTGMTYTQVFGSDQNATMTGLKNSALFPAAGTN